VTRPDPKPPVSPVHPVHLKVSAYDRVAGALLALLWLTGLLVLLLFLLWLTTRAFPSRHVAAIQYVDDLAGGEPAVGTGRDFEEPGLDELQDLAKPSVEESLAAIADVVAAEAAGLEALSAAAAQGQGEGSRQRAGEGGSASVPRWQRWEIQFSAGNLAEYARQLDAFGIELGAVGGRQQIDLAGQLSGNAPRRFQRQADQEDRLYMTWRSGRLRQFDRQLLVQAGIPVADRLLVQFYPPEVEATLARLERERAGKRPLEAIRRTIFGVRRNNAKYEFYVVDQDYR
jgi:hypothetical protein